MHATLILSESEGDLSEFLGLPIVLRVALELARAGFTQLALCGARAARVRTLLAGDDRFLGTVSDYAPEQPTDLVCRSDAFIAPELLRALPIGCAVANSRGVRLAVRVNPIEPAGSLGELVASAELWRLVAVPQPVAAAEISPQYAFALCDREDRNGASRMLLASLIKPSDGPVSRHLNRHVSRAITRLALPLGVTPNMMSVVVLVIGLWAAYCASFASQAVQLFAALLYQLHSILDGCDGEIARLTQRFGKHGALIDSVVDDVCNGAFFVGLSLGTSRTLAESWPLLTGGLTGVAYAGVVVVQYGVVLRATGRGDKTKFWEAEPEPRMTLFALLKALLRRDVFVLLILVAVVLNWTPLAVALFPCSAIGALFASSLRVMRLRRAA